MAEYLLNVFQAGPGCVGQRCRALAAVVEPDRWETDLIDVHANVRTPAPPAELRGHRIRRAPGPTQRRAGVHGRPRVRRRASGRLRVPATPLSTVRYWQRTRPVPAETQTERTAMAP